MISIKSLFKENNWEYSKIRDGFILTENLGSELDSATIIIPSIEETSIEPYDVVELNINGSTKYYCVASSTKQYVTYEKPYKYDYTIMLMSLTKILETIQLPSMTVTNIGQDRSIKFYVENIANYFNYDGQTLSLDIPSKYEDLICPELTLTTPTMREYLDYLFSTQDELAQLTIVNNQFKLKTLDLNNDGGELPLEHIQTMETGNNAEEYVTNLTSTIENAMGQEELIEYIEFRTDEYAFTTDNAKLILSHPIREIDYVLAKNITISVSKNPLGESMIDDTTEKLCINQNIYITKYVLPKDVWESTELVAPNNAYDRLFDSDERQRMNDLYFEIGSNTIENALSREVYKQMFFSYTTPLTIYSAIFNSFYNQLSDYIKNRIKGWHIYINGADITTANFDDIKDLLFEVKYLPYISTKVDIEQNTKASHMVSANSNTNDVNVNINTFLKQNLENVNKVGNDSLVFVGQAKNSNVFNLGMKFNDYILIKLEKTIHRDITLFKGVLSKYFTYKNIFTSIDRTKRYTSLASEDIVSRNEISKKYINIKYDPNGYAKPYNINEILRYKGSYAMFESSYMVGTTENIYRGYCYPALIKSGNSITYSVEAPSNVYFAITKGKIDTYNNSKFQLMEYDKYVNNDGEAVRFRLEIYNQPSFGDGESNFAKYFPRYYADDDTVPRYQTTSGLTLITSGEINILKDSREKIAISLETIFKSGEDSVIIGNSFTDMLFGTIRNNTYEKDGLFINVSHSSISYNQQYATINNMKKCKINVSNGLLFFYEFDDETNNYKLIRSGNFGIYNQKGEMILAVNDYDYEKLLCFTL